MSQIKICNFAEEQTQELKALKKLCETELGWEPPQEYLDEWAKAVLGISRYDQNLVKIAYANGKIIGYCVTIRKLHNYDGVVMDITWKNAYIWDIYIVKEYRNMGVGTALIENTLAYLKSIGG